MKSQAKSLLIVKLFSLKMYMNGKGTFCLCMQAGGEDGADRINGQVKPAQRA